jgi:hypothetical protein
VDVVLLLLFTGEIKKMYYIAREDQIGVMSRVVKRLKDFTPKEDMKYYVRKRADLKSLDYLDVYVGLNGKLKKLNETAMLL